MRTDVQGKKKEGKEVELKKNGAAIPVTNSNKSEYIQLVVDYYIGYMVKAIESIKEGFDMLIPQHMLEEFTGDGMCTC